MAAPARAPSAAPVLYCGALLLLSGGCSFDSYGLAPSSPPAEDGAADTGAADSSAIAKEGPVTKPDTKVKPPADATPKGCPTGKIRCGKVCVNPATDDANCGICGVICKATEKCTSGLCCTKGWANCGDSCSNLKADINNCGKCGKRCKELQICTLGLCCAPGLDRCANKCVNLATDIGNCGKCGIKCKATEDCVGGKCCPKGHSKCGNKCANLKADVNNCGKCGNKCKATQKCKGGKCEATGACVPGSQAQAFAAGMVGCGGKVTFPKRATLCNTLKYKVCGAVQWVTGHGAKAPKYNYWTDDVLHYVGPKHYCFVSPNYGNKCWPSMPMRVCAGDPDPLGNRCNWTGCGYKTPTPKHYFGGCNDNPTAGTLCCPK